MRFLVLLYCFLFTFPGLFSQGAGDEIRFRGGMMLHTGYVKNARTENTINGICKGLGGQLTYTIAPQLRIGTEGYASSYGYPHQEGYYRLGWGGLLIGYQTGRKRLHFVSGITIGGGTVKDLFFIGQDTAESGIQNVVYRRYSSFLVVPAASLEYTAGTRLTCVLKLDYILPFFNSHHSDYAYGPRVYFGILFNRDKE